MKPVRACVLTGYGLNCDYETDFSLKKAGADSRRIHINDLIAGAKTGSGPSLAEFDILVFGGGFSWGDDHGAGVLLASKIKFNMGEQVEEFVKAGKLVIGICNGFQSLVNLGLLPGFKGNYRERRVALTFNDSGNFIDTWVKLTVNPRSPCVFTKGMREIELPVRHGEGKFYAAPKDMARLFDSGQVVMQYADDEGRAAQGRYPMNPNGSLADVAGICDATGRIFGLMPHPEAFHHYTNHPDWNRRKEELRRKGRKTAEEEGEGVRIFRNAVEYLHQVFRNGQDKT